MDGGIAHPQLGTDVLVAEGIEPAREHQCFRQVEDFFARIGNTGVGFRLHSATLLTGQ
ncbi:hypothetical protein D3C72_1609690 [compost metagenome]